MSLANLLKDKIDDIFERAPELKSLDKDRFEIAVGNILNIRYLGGLDLEELIDGIIGGPGDDGIDLCYLFCNDELIRNDETINSIDTSQSSSFELKILQVKTDKGFSVNEFSKVCKGINRVITYEEKSLRNLGVKEDLIEKAKLIQKVLKIANKEGADFRLSVFYISQGDAKKVDNKIKEEENTLRENLKFYVKDIQFDYFGIEELLNITTLPEEKVEFSVEPSIIDLRDEKSSVSGFACFIKGASILDALKDKKTGQLKDDFFDSNVRDFLGEEKAINQSIIDTAQSEEGAEIFWAMNNGITIVGSAVRSTTRENIVVENPQIVNGCQTIHSLYLSSLQKGGLSPKLKVFAKIVQVEDPQFQQDIISASNSQNAVEYTAFKANDSIQRHIEKFLSKKNFYYERRANYYKRKGKKGLSVISIKKMGQIIQTVFLKQSIRALNDVKDIFRDEKLYKNIFNIDADYDAYLFAYVLYKNIWLQKNADLRKHQYDLEIKELLSKSLLPILHVASSLILNLQNPIAITGPERKNKFSAIKKDIFKKIDQNIETIYNEAKEIFLDCAESYQKDTKRNISTLLKQRNFDSKYIIPLVAKRLGEK